MIAFNLCGSCTHIDQLSSGIMRYCEVKRKLQNAFNEPCAAYEDMWQKDMFGEYSLAHDTIKRQQQQLKTQDK